MKIQTFVVSDIISPLWLADITFANEKESSLFSLSLIHWSSLINSQSVLFFSTKAAKALQGSKLNPHHLHTPPSSFNTASE